MKVVIVPDSLKESLSAFEVAKAIEKGIRKVLPDIEVISMPLADGGEGTVDALVYATRGKKESVIVHDPLMRKINAIYGILGDNKTAVIETSAASGLALMTKEERNPMVATSFGTGELIKHALNKGINKFIIGLGGSGINDAGAGLAQALGIGLLDSKGNELPKGGAALSNLEWIDLSGLHPEAATAEFVIASDVTNPLTGPNGASKIFGPQKGATPDMTELLDKSLTNFASVIKSQLNKDVECIPGTGAAGGLGAGILAFFNGNIKPGFPLIAETSGLEEKLQNADLIYTAEGRSDLQTLSGKLPFGVGCIGKEKSIPVILLTGHASEGSEQLLNHGITCVMPFQNGPMTMDESISNAFSLIEFAAENSFRIFLAGRK